MRPQFSIGSKHRFIADGTIICLRYSNISVVYNLLPDSYPSLIAFLWLSCKMLSRYLCLEGR